MCGILGIVGEHYKKVDDLLSGISHRGPDSCGIWQDEKFSVALGHRRLAILDLSTAGHQPMHSHCQRYVIAFNGEIYNFQELKKTLKFTQWSGHSDTEVLLQCIVEWGVEKTLEKLTGMFAFALWDKETREIIFARDRFGEKPLFIGKLGKGLFFSSELRPFYKLVNNKINESSIHYFFQLGYIPHPHTIFNNVYKLPPGTFLKVKENFGEFKIEDAKKFWNFNPFSINKVKISKDNALAEFESKLKEVIKNQMISDVPIGAFLSGGIDSSTVVALAQLISNKPIKTFSLGIKDQSVNEAIFAKKIAEYLKTDHTEFLVTSKEVLDLTPKLVNNFDEPFSDPSLVPTWIVSKLARDHVTVCLSGDGGDELFGGYASYQRADRIFAVKKFLPTFLTPDLVPSIEFKNLGHKIKKGLEISKLRSYSEIFGALTEHNGEKLVLNKNTQAFPRTLMEESRRGAMWWDANYYMSDDILVKVDRMSMKHSLEVRVPFLDHHLTEWIWSLPDDLRFTKDHSKILLKSLLYRHIPREMIERPKMGFGLPIGQWLKKDLKDWAIESLLKPNQFLDVSIIEKLWSEHLQGKRDHKSVLWDVICFNQWLSGLS